MIIELMLLALFLIVTIYTAWTLLKPEPVPASPFDDGKHKSGGNKRFGIGLARQLKVVHLPMEHWQFLSITLMIAMVAGMCMLETFPSHPSLFGLVFVVTVGTLLFGLRELAARRQNLFEERLIDAISLLHAALKGGETPQGAILVASESARGDVKTELAEIARRLSYGATIDRAVAKMVTLYDSEGVRIFSQALILKWEAGGNFTQLISAVHKLVKERVMLRRKLTSQLSGARYSSLLVGIAPYALVPFFISRDPGWLDTLANHPIGPQLLAAAIGAQVMGFFWLRKILRTDR